MFKLFCFTKLNHEIDLKTLSRNCKILTQVYLYYHATQKSEKIFHFKDK